MATTLRKFGCWSVIYSVQGGLMVTNNADFIDYPVFYSKPIAGRLWASNFPARIPKQVREWFNKFYSKCFAIQNRMFFERFGKHPSWVENQ